MRSATRSARAHRESANPSGGVMATRRNANGAGEASVPPAPSSSERETLDASVASLSGLNLDQLRLQWRNHLGGIAPAHLPGWLLMRVLAYRIQATAFGDLDTAILEGPLLDLAVFAIGLPQQDGAWGVCGWDKRRLPGSGEPLSGRRLEERSSVMLASPQGSRRGGSDRAPSTGTAPGSCLRQNPRRRGAR